MRREACQREREWERERSRLSAPPLPRWLQAPIRGTSACPRDTPGARHGATVWAVWEEADMEPERGVGEAPNKREPDR